MKNFNVTKTGIVLVVIIMAFGFVSCSKDEVIEPAIQYTIKQLSGTWEAKNLSTKDSSVQVIIDENTLNFWDFKKVKGQWSLLAPKGMNTFKNISIKNNVVYGKLQLSNGAIERYRKLNLNKEMIDLAESWSNNEKEIFKIISIDKNTMKIKALSRDGKSYIEETLTKKAPVKTETLKGTWYSNSIKVEEDNEIRWVINIDNDRMDKYIQAVNGDGWDMLRTNFFTCYRIQYNKQVITGKVIDRIGAISKFLSGGLNKEMKKILEQRKKEHDAIKVIGFEGEKLKMELLEKEEAQVLTFEKGEQVKMLEIKTSWK